MRRPKISSTSPPVAVVGAGDLVSHVVRGDEVNDTANYRFSIFRLNADLRATHALRPEDLPDLIKLCQVVTVAIVDDGWLPDETRDALRKLEGELRMMTDRWSDAQHG